MTDAEVFEGARARLTGRAYRMLGTLADADDVVQDAWLRWERTDRAAIVNPEAWLNTTVSRLALDRLRQRKREEQRYVGPWLPAPLVERSNDPEQLAELADSMTTAFLMMLERLTPDERAAFLLADVFGERFDDVAATLDRSAESCRQLASRARRKLRDAREQRHDDAHAAADVVRRFLVALATGDEQLAMACLAPDAVYLGDGGPDRHAARHPVRGPGTGSCACCARCGADTRGSGRSRRHWWEACPAWRSTWAARSMRSPVWKWSTVASHGSPRSSTPPNYEASTAPATRSSSHPEVECLGPVYRDHMPGSGLTAVCYNMYVAPSWRGSTRRRWPIRRTKRSVPRSRPANSPPANGLPNGPWPPSSRSA
ncbi:MAG TPA: sigma-70 family RNA polymerase sigma factor [Ilumatobacter sp.]|nr:sigma-70 family RNA polymerase sigma factor [Ilumatobacter sp.]